MWSYPCPGYCITLGNRLTPLKLYANGEVRTAVRLARLTEWAIA